VRPVQHLLLPLHAGADHTVTQTAVCNRHHSVEQQLCRWLLLTLDRVSSGELIMTQELVASMLGRSARRYYRRRRAKLRTPVLSGTARPTFSARRYGWRPALECYRWSRRRSAACCPSAPPSGVPAVVRVVPPFPYRSTSFILFRPARAFAIGSFR